MAFFTLQELRSYGNKIACDTFMHNHKLTNYVALFAQQDPGKVEREVEPEPDLQIFEIRMRKLEEPEREMRDDLDRNKTKKQGRTATGQSRPSRV